MNRKKLMATMAGVMALSVGLTACGKDSAGSGDPEAGKNNEAKIFKLEATNPDKVPDAAKQRKDTLVIGLEKPDGIFNPLYADSAYDIMVLDTMFSSLLNVKDDGTLEPGLCDLPKISEDKKTYTYKLKDG